MTSRKKLLLCAVIMAAIAAPAALRGLRAIDPSFHFAAIEYAERMTK